MPTLTSLGAVLENLRLRERRDRRARRRLRDRRPRQRREKIFSAGIEVMLGGEAIAHSHHNCLSRARHAATNRVVQIEIADHESAAVAPEESGFEPGRPFRRVDAQNNRAAGSVDSALDNGSDRDTTPERDRNGETC